MYEKYFLNLQKKYDPEKLLNGPSTYNHYLFLNIAPFARIRIVTSPISDLYVLVIEYCIRFIYCVPFFFVMTGYDSLTGRKILTTILAFQNIIIPLIFLPSIF